MARHEGAWLSGRDMSDSSNTMAVPRAGQKKVSKLMVIGGLAIL